MVGGTQRVLVEGNAKRDPGELCGRSSGNRMVNFAGPRELIGRMVEVDITAARAHTLRGEYRVTSGGGEYRVPSGGGEVRVPPTAGEARVTPPAAAVRIAR
ncbi:MAG: TRAM domain-containing protein, partial [Burkholderiales bacterium]|nr:TRAM domain-containing protein [Burkholderiales bacterium]